MWALGWTYNEVSIEAENKLHLCKQSLWFKLFALIYISFFPKGFVFFIPFYICSIEINGLFNKGQENIYLAINILKIYDSMWEKHKISMSYHYLRWIIGSWKPSQTRNLEF